MIDGFHRDIDGSESSAGNRRDSRELNQPGWDRRKIEGNIISSPKGRMYLVSDNPQFSSQGK